jgi:hypothetical protein
VLPGRIALAATAVPAQVPRLFPGPPCAASWSARTAGRAAQRQAGAAGPGARIRNVREPLRGDPAACWPNRSCSCTTRTDPGGQLLDVWILTPSEAPTSPGQERRPGAKPGSSTPWQRWSRSHEQPKKVFIRTFGCQMNEYDSDKMSDVLRAAEGYEPTDDVEQADLILFNTCSVREKAQEKVFSDLGRVKHLKPRAC